MRTLVFCMILLVGYYAYFVFFVFMNKVDGSFTPSVTAALPFVCIVLDYLAFRGILKDELLVRSLDRLR
jgi:drug/metabolite transporter (DMT)-like permease